MRTVHFPSSGRGVCMSGVEVCLGGCVSRGRDVCVQGVGVSGEGVVVSQGVSRGCVSRDVYTHQTQRYTPQRRTPHPEVHPLDQEAPPLPPWTEW